MTLFGAVLFFCDSIAMLASFSSDPFQKQALVEKIAASDREMASNEQLLRSAFPGEHIPTFCPEYHVVYMTQVKELLSLKSVDLASMGDYRTPSVKISMTMKRLRSLVRQCLDKYPLINDPLIAK